MKKNVKLRLQLYLTKFPTDIDFYLNLYSLVEELLFMIERLLQPFFIPVYFFLRHLVIFSNSLISGRTCFFTCFSSAAFPSSGVPSSNARQVSYISLSQITCSLETDIDFSLIITLLWVNPFKPITNAFFRFCIAGKRSFFNSYTVPH